MSKETQKFSETDTGKKWLSGPRPGTLVFDGEFHMVMKYVSDGYCVAISEDPDSFYLQAKVTEVAEPVSVEVEQEEAAGFAAREECVYEGEELLFSGEMHAVTRSDFGLIRVYSEGPQGVGNTRERMTEEELAAICTDDVAVENYEVTPTTKEEPSPAVTGFAAREDVIKTMQGDGLLFSGENHAVTKTNWGGWTYALDADGNVKADPIDLSEDGFAALCTDDVTINEFGCVSPIAKEAPVEESEAIPLDGAAESVEKFELTFRDNQVNVIMIGGPDYMTKALHGEGGMDATARRCICEFIQSPDSESLSMVVGDISTTITRIK